MAKILIAEDNDDIRGLVIRALSDDGHDLVATEDGAATLAAPDTTSTSAVTRNGPTTLILGPR